MAQCNIITGMIKKIMTKGEEVELLISCYSEETFRINTEDLPWKLASLLAILNVENVKELEGREVTMFNDPLYTRSVEGVELIKDEVIPLNHTVKKPYSRGDFFEMLGHVQNLIKLEEKYGAQFRR